MTNKTNKNLKEAGLRATLPRIKILEMLENHKHISAEDIYRDLIENRYDVGLATVYRVLTQFENAGIVIKHSFESSKAVYELNNSDHHDHMVCLDSGDIVEFHDDIIETRQEEIAKKHGFKLIDHSMVLYVKKTNS
ncbi:ferric iron uptake transcriptional regulator [SAR86 cluster bacterium]|jgi:Fur family ferric uptake transcriptional regulator|nr:ferric iron uptake transcriptional regulator [SAR86 cluster bacterium]|tara:strand:+ start:10318 stop:10725 length:408 start_codon:yes stop_codon:yes gene_type:complete